MTALRATAVLFITIAAFLFAGCGKDTPSSAPENGATYEPAEGLANDINKEIKTRRVVTETPIDTEYFKYHDDDYLAVSADCRHIAYSCNLLENGVATGTFAVEDGVNHGIVAELVEYGFMYGPGGNTLVYFVYGEDDMLDIVIGGRRDLRYDTSSNFFEFSPDGRKYAYLAADEAERIYVFVNDNQYGPYEEVVEIGDAACLVFSPDGNRIAFAVIPLGGYRRLPVIDGEVLDKYQGVWQITFSEDSVRALLIVENEQDEDYTVVIGEEVKIGPSYSKIRGACFVPGTHEIAVIAKGESGKFAVIRGKPGEEYEDIWTMRFSDDGAHYAYIGVRGRDRYVVIDGESRGPYKRAFSLKFFNSGKHSFYFAEKDGEWRPVVDGVPGPVYSDVATAILNPTRREAIFTACTKPRVKGETRDWRIVTCEIDDSGKVSYRDGEIYSWIGDYPCMCGYTSASRDPKFSPDGSRLAFLAVTKEKEVVVLDGDESRKFDSIDSLSFSPDGGGFGCYVVEGEEEFIMIDGVEGVRYERIFGSSNDDHAESIKAFEWDSNDSFHYLALRGGVIYLVEEEIVEE